MAFLATILNVLHQYSIGAMEYGIALMEVMKTTVVRHVKSMHVIAVATCTH